MIRRSCGPRVVTPRVITSQNSLFINDPTVSPVRWLMTVTWTSLFTSLKSLTYLVIYRRLSLGRRLSPSGTASIGVVCYMREFLLLFCFCASDSSFVFETRGSRIHLCRRKLTWFNRPRQPNRCIRLRCLFKTIEFYTGTCHCSSKRFRNGVWRTGKSHELRLFSSLLIWWAV